jgi:LacI family transcriptional regulator
MEPLKVILLLETSRAYTRGILRGITKYSRLYGSWVFHRKPLLYIEHSKTKKILTQLKDLSIDGVFMDNLKNVKEITAMGLPVIHLKQVEGLPSIVGDDIAIGEIAGEYLLNRNFRHFAYCGFSDTPWSQKRGECFSRRITEAGFKTHFYKELNSRGWRSWSDEQILIVDWLKSLPKPVGVMAANDDRGQQVIEACKIAGLHIPEEVAVLGVDNDDMVCDLTDPPLSSVALNLERAGYDAAELLDGLMAGKKMEGQTIVLHPTHIVTRQSTDILVIEDSEVAGALRFIRQRSKNVITVDEAVNATALSRRTLERRFREVLGRSILQEIRRVRVEQVIRMMVETNLPISKIALDLGYPSIQHIARYFRQEKGISPYTYRKQYGSR